MTIDDVSVAPSLPLELPEFEGIQPVGVVTKINGAGQRIRRPMHLGEKVVLVVEAEVGTIGHGQTDEGVKRLQALKVADLYELEGKPGAVLLRSLRQAYRLSDDLRHGRKGLPGVADQPEPAGPGIAITVDENGIVLTDAEVAAMRGEVLGLPVVDVAVLVFDDGSRALWPDDFADAAGPHPEAGERIRKPGAKPKDEPVLISRVLDADTGETLEEWTEDDEALRLLAEEQEAAREEAREDRKVHEELLAARDAAAEALDRVDALAEEDELDPADFDGTGPLPEVASGPDRPDEEVFVEDDEATITELDPYRIEASQLLSDPHTGNYRAIGSVKADLVTVTNRDVLLAAIELEIRGKNRKGLLEALERRSAELFSAHEAVPSAEIPAEPDAFEVPDEADAIDEFAEPDDLS